MDRPRTGRRRPALFWRVFVANATLLVLAGVLLVITPVTVSDPVGPIEATVVGLGVAAMLALNLVLIRRAFAPLERLAAMMGRVGLLRPGERIPVYGPDRELVEVTTAFNEMLSRLEAEQRESTRKTVAAQESERRRIARELHDEIGQGLTAILLQLSRAKRDAGDPALAAQLDEAEATARAGIAGVKRIVRSLRPEALEDLGLGPALTDLAERVGAEAGLVVALDLEDELPPLDEEVELAIYRVAQECLTNAVRHSGATTVELALNAGPRGVRLTVRDDGRGLDGGAEPGHGIRGMLERALLVGGRLVVEHSSDGGVEVRFDVPAQTPERRGAAVAADGGADVS